MAAPARKIGITLVDADFIAQTQAAGLRHRRDGLAYRLRHSNARWSHRMFRMAHRLHAPWIYISGARFGLPFYQSVTWSRGRLGKLLDALLPQAVG